MKILAISRNENSVYKKQNVEFKGSINPAKLTNSVSGAKQNSSQSILKKIFSLFKPKQKNADQLMQQYTALYQISSWVSSMPKNQPILKFYPKGLLNRTRATLLKRRPLIPPQSCSTNRMRDIFRSIWNIPRRTRGK